MTERLRAGEIEIAYETFGAPGDPPLLLIMGLGMQMLAWRDDLCGLLADQGFRAIRFDNRDVGLSTHLDDAPEPDLPELIAGDHSSAPYQIEDMAEDALGLLNGLGIERAHVVGASMGGYIAQALAIRRPDRVLSLTSIMSTPSVEVGRATRDAQVVLLAPPATSRDAAAQRAVEVMRVIGSPDYPFDEQEVVDLARQTYDRHADPRGVLRQLAAIVVSSDRTARTDARHSRRGRPARAARGRQGHGRSDPRRTTAHVPGYGARPAEGAVAADCRCHRRPRP